MFSSMNRHLLLTILVLSGGSLSHGTPVTFNVNELDLNNGYKIAGGTIEVSMDLSTITDFTVEVTGPHPYTFSSTKTTPDVLTNASLFDITSGSVGVVFDFVSNGPTFVGMDNSTSWCLDSIVPGGPCQQRLWLSRGNRSIEYQQEDALGFRFHTRRNFSPGRFEFATAIPEPSSAMFFIVRFFGRSGNALVACSSELLGDVIPSLAPQTRLSIQVFFVAGVARLPT